MQLAGPFYKKYAVVSLFNTSAACKHRVSGSLSLPSRGPFHLSFTVLFAIGHWVVFSLTEWSPLLPTRFLVSRGTLDSASGLSISDTRLSLPLAGLPIPFSYLVTPLLQSAPQKISLLVWALSISLAATLEIDVSFFSSGYLDVSLPRVPSI